MLNFFFLNLVRKISGIMLLNFSCLAEYGGVLD